MKFTFLDVGLVLLFIFALSVLVSRMGSAGRPTAAAIVKRRARRFSEKPAPAFRKIGAGAGLTLQEEFHPRKTF